MDNVVKNIGFDLFDDAVCSVISGDYFNGILKAIVSDNSDLSVNDYFYKIDGDTVYFNIVFNLVPSLESFNNFCKGFEGVDFNVLVNNYVRYNDAFLGGRTLLINYLLMDLLGDSSIMIAGSNGDDVFVGEQLLKDYLNFNVKINSDIAVELSYIVEDRGSDLD